MHKAFKLSKVRLSQCSMKTRPDTCIIVHATVGRSSADMLQHVQNSVSLSA